MYTNPSRRPARAFPFLAVVAFLYTAPLLAQAPPTGRIEGQVTDSLHDRPAAGATVFASRISPQPGVYLSVIADRDGRFRFDSLVAGRYAVNFFAPELDSLELVLPDREVVLGEGGRERVALAVPSAATLRLAVCPGLQLAPGKGAVLGVVTDAETQRPIAGATVVVAWHELSVDRATLKVANEDRRGAVRADSLGRYRACGVPAGEWLVVQAQDSSWSSGAVETIVDSAVTVRQLALSIDRSGRPVAAAPAPAATAPAAAPAGSVLEAPGTLSGTASLSGVVSGVGDRPLADVQLRVAGAVGSARSDSLGRYSLTGLPAGTQMLEARRVGYVMVRVPVQLRGEHAATQDVAMTRIVSLDSIRIVAQRSRYPEFERHRRNAFGRYLDEADILQRNPFMTSDLLRMLPGFRIEHRGGEDVVVSSRGSTSLRARSCPMNIVIDGIQGMDIDMVHPADIAAMETYPSHIGVPVEYAMQSPCGAVIIWTKR